MTTAPIYPQADPWTVDDLDRLPDGSFYEIIDGSLLVSPPPAMHHQIVAARLLETLNGSAPPGLMALTPAGVDIGLSYLVPDVVVVQEDVALANPTRLDPRDVLLVVEVISPSNAKMDRWDKPIRYAEAGIPHFWRVELQGDRSPYVVRYGLDGDRYVELGTVFAGDDETVDVTFPVRLRPGELLRRR